jgi:hypothetical protein
MITKNVALIVLEVSEGSIIKVCMDLTRDTDINFVYKLTLKKNHLLKFSDFICS